MIRVKYLCCQLQTKLGGDRLRLTCSSYWLFGYLSYNEMCLHYGARQTQFALSWGKGYKRFDEGTWDDESLGGNWDSGAGQEKKKKSPQYRPVHHISSPSKVPLQFFEVLVWLIIANKIYNKTMKKVYFKLHIYRKVLWEMIVASLYFLLWSMCQLVAKAFATQCFFLNPCF